MKSVILLFCVLLFANSAILPTAPAPASSSKIVLVVSINNLVQVRRNIHQVSGMHQILLTPWFQELPWFFYSDLWSQIMCPYKKWNLEKLYFRLPSMWQRKHWFCGSCWWPMCEWSTNQKSMQIRRSLQKWGELQKWGLFEQMCFD